MFPYSHAAGLPRSFSLLCVALTVGVATPGTAIGSAKARAEPTSDFRTLAAQRPWACTAQADPVMPDTAWIAAPAQCAWQNRLQMRQWRGVGGNQKAACVSVQAQWWAWLRPRTPGSSGSSAAWRSNWTAQSMIDESGPEKRIVILQLASSGQWNATEWRWTPSLRAATRRWQEGRWKLLVARAEQIRAAALVPQAAPEGRLLRNVLEATLANRVSEIGDQSWQWHADGFCLRVDAAGLGQQIMQLPYRVDDSRLEQRAAMQLQLTRRYPKATWLTDFTLVPAAAHARGGAKFYAVWLEQATLKGQLWIPTRSDGPLVRLRITTTLPVSSGGQPATATIERAEQVVTRELTGIATRWASQYE